MKNIRLGKYCKNVLSQQKIVGFNELKIFH
jgi:hypothetical protein